MRKLLAAVATLCAITAAPAGAVTFNLVDTGGAAVGSQARAGFDAAAAYWSSVLTNNITVTLNIGFQSLNPGVLAQTGSSKSVVYDTAIYQALAASQTSSLDHSAVSTLQPLNGNGAVAMTVNQYANTGTHAGYVDTATRADTDSSGNNRALAVNNAELRALGITTTAGGTALPSGPDGSIVFSSNYNFDFDPGNGVNGNAYDFIGVAIHEFGHALGFESGVDTYDYYTSGNGPGGSCLAAGNCSGMSGVTNLENYAVGSVLDLFRYSAPGTLDWSTSSTPKYFSIDGGQTSLFGNSTFAFGSYNGDGYQASHWQESAAGLAQIGIMDPTSALGQMQEVTANDLAAFDAMGYTLSFDVLNNSNYRQSTGAIYSAQALAAVPEPATWAQMLLGFAGVGGLLRRRTPRRVKV